MFNLGSFSRLPLVVLLLASMQSNAPGCLAAGSDFRDAVALYDQKNYSAASQAFAALSKKDPGNASALYYSGNCEIGLGHSASAISIYKALITKFPSSGEATSARTVLQRMGVRAIDSQDDTLSAEKAASRSSTSSTSSRSSRHNMSADAKDQVIEKLVVKVRALSDRPNVSEATIYSIKESLRQYPTPLLGVLWSRGCKIFVTPTMIDKEPGLVNRQPAGYEEGDTYRNCPGMFNGNIVLCEKVFVGDGPDLKTAPDIVGTLRHELGHAVDWYLGRLTAKDDYKHQYLLDLGTMDEDVKSKLAYFCQKDFRGPAETFAEIMCFKYGGRPSGSTKTTLVGSSFKLTRAYVDKVIDELDGSKSPKL